MERRARATAAETAESEASARDDAGAERTFVVYDHCVGDDVREEGFKRDFWNAARSGARIVHHNYGRSSADDFFKYDRGVELRRMEIADGLYAWTTTTRAVDWEWGVALGNAEGDAFYEIGSNDEHRRKTPPLAPEPRTTTACSDTENISTAW